MLRVVLGRGVEGSPRGGGGYYTELHHTQKKAKVKCKTV